MQAARNIAEIGVNFTDSLTACDMYNINNGIKQLIRNNPGKTEITGRLQLVSPVLLGPVTPAARGDYRFMAKCSDHYTKFKAIYIIPTKDKALTTLVKLMQDFVIPLGLCLQHLRADGTALPKSLWGKITATAVFLPNRPPSKTLSLWEGHPLLSVPASSATARGLYS